MEATYTILRCPDCRAQRHDYPCQSCGSGRSGETVPVIPLEGVIHLDGRLVLAEHMGQTTVRAEDQRVRGASLAGEPDEEH